MSKTNNRKIKEISKKLLNLPLNSFIIPDLPIFLCHPFTNSAFTSINGEILNLLEEGNEEKWKRYISSMIDDSHSNLFKIYMLLNKPYRLFWVYLNQNYFNENDFGKFLSDAWVSSENPNKDENVSLNESIEMFKKAKSQYLMEKEDLEVFKNIPDKIKLYRGVSHGRTPYGLSYTSSLEKAEWFRDRFKQGGFIIELEVNKKDILCYFNTRGEDEYVVDVFKYNEEIENQLRL